MKMVLEQITWVLSANISQNHYLVCHITGMFTDSIAQLFSSVLLQNLFLWDCRKKQILPNMYGFRAKIIPKYTTGRIISNKEFFMKK